MVLITQERKIIGVQEERKLKILDSGLDISILKHGDILNIINKEELVHHTPVKNLNLLTTWSRGPIRIDDDERREKTVIWRTYKVIKNPEGYLLDQLTEVVLGQFGNSYGEESEKLSYRDGERYLDEAGL